MTLHGLGFLSRAVVGRVLAGLRGRSSQLSAPIHIVNWSPLTLRSSTMTGTPCAQALATDVGQRRRLVRRDDQQIDPLLQEVLDVGHLLGVVLCGVGEDHLELRVSRGRGGDLVVHRLPPRLALVRLRHADQVVVFLWRCRPREGTCRKRSPPQACPARRPRCPTDGQQQRQRGDQESFPSGHQRPSVVFTRLDDSVDPLFRATPRAGGGGDRALAPASSSDWRKEASARSR